MTLKRAIDSGPEVFAWAVLVASVVLVATGVVSETVFLALALSSLAVGTGLRVKKLRAGAVELEGASDDDET